jgi:selenide, water dikinase
MDPIKLTSLSHAAGCGCKLGPAELSEILRPLHDHPATHHPDLIVGFSGSDDAGVLSLGDGRTIVQTVDFFTPIVDDAYDWGRIAAANALSDLYAMGAEPLSALQLVGWPRDDLPVELLGLVISGGADVMAEAGCVIVGGHSIDDREPKYGFAVTGLAPRGDILTNSAAVPGQNLVLTKPIGTGIIATAVKNDRASGPTAEAAIAAMTTLNRGASNAARRIGVRAATDVTGFGLLGHLAEMVRGSEVSAVLDVSSVPLLPDVRDLVGAGMVPGGTRRNLASVESMVAIGSTSRDERLILADAQTSGGLLLAVDAPLTDALHQALRDEGSEGWTVGSFIPREFAHGPSGQIELR